MAQAEIQKIIHCDSAKFFETVVKYEDYPQFVDGVKSVNVERKGPGKARATYHVSVMKDVNYVLDLDEDAAAGTVRWHLVSSDTFKKNSGGWDIKTLGDGKCDVRYFLDVEFKIPVPGFILNRLVKGSLPSMIESFNKRATRK